MEIKNVEDEEKKEYPEEQEVKKEVIEKRIPKKWIALGITAVAATVIGSGIYLVNTKSVENQVMGALIDQREAIVIFNYKFDSYSGKQSGSNVKSLLMTVINSNNAIENKVKVNGKESDSDISQLAQQILNSKTYTVHIIYAETGYISEIMIKGTGLE